MAISYNQRYVALGSGSTATSNPFFVGDFRLLTVSFESRASLGASRITITGSNADGFQAADLGGPSLTTGWSLVTGINMVGVTPGMVTFDPPGYRLVRASVDVAAQSVASYTTAVFHWIRY